jgi:hypothetical protein
MNGDCSVIGSAEDSPQGGDDIRRLLEMKNYLGNQRDFEEDV